MRRLVKLITDDEKRHFVDLYLQGDTTMRELAKTAGVSHATVHRWIASYTTNGTFGRYQDVKNTSTYKNLATIKAQEAEIARLKAALEKAELRALALDTMIDVAEETLKINIRKKAGAKQ